MPVWVGLPHRYPEQLATSFLAPENCKEIWVLVFDRPKTCFLYQTFQNQAAIRDHRKMENLLFCPFWSVLLLFWLFFFFLPFAFSGLFHPPGRALGAVKAWVGPQADAKKAIVKHTILTF